MKATPKDTAIRLFCGYHEKDSKFFKDLCKHLQPLVRSKLLLIRGPRDVPAGSVLGDALEKELQQAQLIVLLLSPDLIAEDVWWPLLEAPPDAKLHNDVYLLPIRVREVDLTNTSLLGRVMLPRDEPRP